MLYSHCSLNLFSSDPASDALRQVTELFSGYVAAMLAEYAAAPATAWKAKVGCLAPHSVSCCALPSAGREVKGCARSHACETLWAQDCAIYLVSALTVRGKTAAAGATATNQLVNLQDFFRCGSEPAVW